MRETLAEGTAFAAVGDLGGATIKAGGEVTAAVGTLETKVGVGLAAAWDDLGSSPKQATEKAAGQTVNKTIAVLTRTFSHRNKRSTL